MKVKEMIEKLKEFNPELNVLILDNEHYSLVNTKNVEKINCYINDEYQPIIGGPVYTRHYDNDYPEIIDGFITDEDKNTKFMIEEAILLEFN